MPLTRRERECLLWAARGKTYARIAKKMSIAPSTVKHHLDRARMKLDGANLTHAVALAIAAEALTVAEIFGQ